MFAVAYLSLAFTPPPLPAPSLLTTWGLSHLDPGLASATSGSTFDYLAVSYFPLAPAPPINPASVPFLQVGHCLAALVAGLIGAGVAVLVGRETIAPSGEGHVGNDE